QICYLIPTNLFRIIFRKSFHTQLTQMQAEQYEQFYHLLEKLTGSYFIHCTYFLNVKKKQSLHYILKLNRFMHLKFGSRYLYGTATLEDIDDLHQNEVRYVDRINQLQNISEESYKSLFNMTNDVNLYKKNVSEFIK